MRMPPCRSSVPVILTLVLSLVIPVAMPTVSYAGGAAVEICDNCVDDDHDPGQLVDRADPACVPLANGGGVGIGDAARGKAIFKCHTAIEKAGLTFSGKRLKAEYACVLPGFACIQTKPGDTAACLAKANVKCDKLAPKAIADHAKLIALITKACGDAVLNDADRDAPTGLGFMAEEAACEDEGNPTNETIGGLASCLALQHVCRTNRTFGAVVPRAREILLAMGRDPDAELPCLTVGTVANGNEQGLGTLGKAAVKCQKGIAKASVKLGSAVAKDVQKCVDLGVACLQLKDGGQACIAAAQAKCAKLSAKLQDQQKGTLFKVLGAATKTCAGLSTAQVQQVEGLGFGVQSSRCGALGAAQIGTQGTILCAGVQQFCEGKQMLVREIPRLDEFLTLLNVHIIGL
jgi:hypothetical protein